MDYKKIIEENKKYHYFIISTNKIIFLSSSNDKSEAKQLALKKLNPNIDKLIGKKIFLLKLKIVYNAFIKQSQKKNSLNLIGGPINISIERGLIVNENKIKNEKEGGNSNIYLSDKYLKNNNDITKEFKKILKEYIDTKTSKSIVDVTIL